MYKSTDNHRVHKRRSVDLSTVKSTSYSLVLKEVDFKLYCFFIALEVKSINVNVCDCGHEHAQDCRCITPSITTTKRGSVPSRSKFLANNFSSEMNSENLPFGVLGYSSVTLFNLNCFGFSLCLSVMVNSLAAMYKCS